MHAVSGLQRRSVPRPPSDRVQVVVRVDRAWLKKADELAKRRSTPGHTWTKSDAFREAIAAGFDALAAKEKSSKG